MLHSAVKASSEQTSSPLVSKGSRVVISYCLFLFIRASFFFFFFPTVVHPIVHDMSAQTVICQDI